MAVHPQPVQAPGRVLSTLNVDGTRRWLRPRPSSGRWWDRRRVVAYALMFVFFAASNNRCVANTLCCTYSTKPSDQLNRTPGCAA